MKELEDGIDDLFKKGFFLNKREYRLIRRAVRVMFSPQFLSKSQKVIKPMVKLLKRIQQEGVHRCVIVSNWDAASFNLFLTTPIGLELLKSIGEDDMIISGRISINKPHPRFFKHVLEKYALHHQHCLLIDNEISNCKAAESLGIPYIHFTGNTDMVEKQLINLGILKS